MKIKIMRKTEAPDFTEGLLYIDDVFECYTVEDTDRHLESGGDKINKLTAIPRGTYPVDITYSNRFKKPLILIDNVPGFTGIRVHSGNSSLDTEGCIIVGSVNKSDDDNWVGGSRKAYTQLHKKIEEAILRDESIKLEIV